MYYFHQREPLIEQDPNITKMRLDVFEAMENIVNVEYPEKSPINNFSGIKFISFEEAIRELADIKQGKFV